ncbi:MAG: cell division protein SepF [Mycoplasma sp.]|nr:cell division protein SepF [Mycoplasma sp.]
MLKKFLNNNDKKEKEFSPKKFDQVQNIANHIILGGKAIANLTNLPREEAIRTSDFLSGVIYAINGSVKKLGTQKYLFLPK